jgi:hypothetical protein
MAELLKQKQNDKNPYNFLSVLVEIFSCRRKA